MCDFALFADRLRSLIKEHGLTQVRLAEELGISKFSLNNYVKGDRLPETTILYALAKYFDTTMEWLLTGEDNCTKVKSKNQNDATEFYRHFSNLDPEGKIMVQAACYKELRRMKENTPSPPDKKS